jgi:hypothetical protein
MVSSEMAAMTEYGMLPDMAELERQSAQDRGSSYQQVSVAGAAAGLQSDCVLPYLDLLGQRHHPPTHASACCSSVCLLQRCRQLSGRR